ncbi:DNA topoisomerase I [Opitutaceae bacterium EW11]|nr:DNA topoisomerase I [Opitutaceae bacterium EW11]
MRKPAAPRSAPPPRPAGPTQAGSNGSNGTPPRPHPEAIETAKAAGLRYVSDTQPGIVREPAGKGFRYRGPDGNIVKDPATLGRIKRLAIPPAWTEVWICPSASGHIQATGRDARKRKQYRYHTDWRTVRDENKYERMIAFGQALPRIRARVARDLSAPGLGRTKVLAAVARLLETTLIRIGNEEYAKENHSFGLSTMRDRHVSIRRDTLHFEFRGKSGRRHEIDLQDPRLAAVVRETQDLPGQDLFQYLDAGGDVQKITSEDVNGYLREIAGSEFSAKDFRTWAGTVLAAMALSGFDAFATKAQAKKNLVRAVELVAERLGNTPAVCRKCYIHPVVLQSYLDGATVQVLKGKAAAAPRGRKHSLAPDEQAVLAFLQRRLEAAARAPSLREQLARSLGRRRKSKASTRR